MKTPTLQSSDSGRLPYTERFGASPPDSPTPDAASPEKLEPPQSPDDLWSSWKASGDQEAFQRTVRALDPTIRKGLSAFANGQESLLTQGRLLAAEAVKAFDPAALEKEGRKAASLSSYVYGRLQRLQRVAADRSAAVRVPERSRMDAILVRDAVNEWRDAHDDDPDIQTLTELTGLSKSRLQLASRAYREISAAGLETEKGDTLLQADEDAQQENDIWRDYVYHDLDQKSRRIFELTTGYGGSKVLPKQEIAVRLKMTPAAVSSRIATIQKRLQSRPAGEII